MQTLSGNGRLGGKGRATGVRRCPEGGKCPDRHASRQRGRRRTSAGVGGHLAASHEYPSLSRTPVDSPQQSTVAVRRTIIDWFPLSWLDARHSDSGHVGTIKFYSRHHSVTVSRIGRIIRINTIVVVVVVIVAGGV